ncbi:6,7-dimethyl-8-ribityllumazine synthase [Candidatus Kaiserbacteria bacterium CG10_big_fil_rev_8_21_14_0_10_59_10]|uniref:6,7-dimethyl-8-ribityllumazine synthase n=1 Tax=Candidatus Kaiserbacteria bacterium CG10_big_fil_rev_8_21_14_0_10_59_10 TaxID=1974612 RepID=A0A2H0UAH2_9BACT|nr:MAG: 6,7-dimethyl-8-ribityllumazine synthase [Candidatus Kaiserbacteria bacterium CG10_big_fil_rev_8_21_14_0_10_59_10]
MQRKEYARKKKTGDASGLSVGVVVSEFNHDITGGLLEGALDTLRAWKVAERSIAIVRVPGSFEIPLACRNLLKGRKKLDAIVALGCVIKGETKHDEYISSAVSQALIRLMLDTGVPIGFGIITPNSLAQAKARSRGKENKGREAAAAALLMALLGRTTAR